MSRIKYKTLHFLHCVSRSWQLVVFYLIFYPLIIWNLGDFTDCGSVTSVVRVLLQMAKKCYKKKVKLGANWFFTTTRPSGPSWRLNCKYSYMWPCILCWLFIYRTESVTVREIKSDYQLISDVEMFFLSMFLFFQQPDLPWMHSLKWGRHGESGC